ncbi:MAG: hypothetical protein Q9217_006785 [Psora testacea]
MPSTIPYDPSLVLANVVSKEALGAVEEISKAQAPVDAAQEDLNALLAARRSLDMTKTELANLNIDTKPVADALKKLNASITTSATNYALEKIKAETKLQELRKKIHGLHSQVETPVDYVKTEIKSLPLAADSMSMDVQYFSLDSYDQNANSYATAVSTFVSSSVDFLGEKAQIQMSNAAQNQISHQLQSHRIVGTLVLSVSCTHKNASVLAPFVLNVDKGIKVWNHLFPKDQLKPTNKAEMSRLALKDNLDGPKFSIISGMTFGSSFVGMVHILNVTDTSVSQSLSSFATSLQSQMDAGAWFESASGGFGVNATIGNEVKNLLSAQNITSHVTLICMGVIPSIVANDVKIGAEKFAEFDPKSSMEAISTIQNATVADQGSVNQAADAARTGQQMVSLKATEIKSALSALQEVEDAKNKILDINSMMTALDDYLKKAADGKAGIPINYYLKDITKGMLAEMWVNKYFPGRYIAIQSDDSGGKNPKIPEGGNGGNTGDDPST